MRNNSYRVAVHIVTYNSGHTLEACLQALHRQSFSNFIMCLIDNNSTDNTLQIAKKYQHAIFVKNTINKGYAAAHNLALSKTQSEYVLTLNPDVLLDKFFLANMISAMDKAGARTGSAAGLLLRTNSMNTTSHAIDGAGLSMKRSHRQTLRYEGKKLQVAEQTPTEIFGPDGAAAFYRRAMLNDIDKGHGMFDEDFFMHKEDVDVCWRAQLLNWTSLFVPTAKAYHIRTFRAGRRKNIDKKVRLLAVRNRYYLMIKNELPSLYIQDFFWIFLYDIGIFLYILFFEQSSLTAYIQVFHNLSSLKKKRHTIQKTCKVLPAYMKQWFREGYL